MRYINRPAHILLIVVSIGFAAESWGDDLSPKKLQEQRKLLASVERNMDSAEVLKILGKPDEIRKVPEDRLLDGIRFSGGAHNDSETERWAYGVLAPGMFAAIGYVSMDRNGRVITAISPDHLCNYKRAPLHQVPATTEQPVATPTYLSCHLGPAKLSENNRRITTTVTLKNDGSEEFRLKHDAAYAIRRFLIVEVYDSKKTLLWREDEMRYHSPFSPNPDEWPVLSVPAGESKSKESAFNPSCGFGRLPAGKYSMRVYFPFEYENRKYYPSNLIYFESSAPAQEKETPTNMK